MLAILDYKAGNQTSVARALNYLGIGCKITENSSEIFSSEGIIFPGVGAAGQAMHQLASSGLEKVLREAVARGIPVLGICLGCQILLDYSEENDTQTLGLISGNCVAFDPAWAEEDGQKIRIPHMGWNSFSLQKDCPLFSGISPDSQFFFVHGYYPAPASEYVIATTNYGQDFCSVFGKDNLWAVQFHPEKSGRPGLALLNNFYGLCKGEIHA